MIRYLKFWEYAEKMGITGYALEKKYGINSRQIQRLKHGEDIRLSTLNRICSIVGCTPADVIEYTPDTVEPVTIDGQTIMEIQDNSSAGNPHVSKKKESTRETTVIGDNLKALMKELHISGPELSRRSEVPESTINRIRYSVTRNPRTETLISIAEALGVPLEALTTPRDDDSTKKEPASDD